jgi:acid phosphatase
MELADQHEDARLASTTATAPRVTKVLVFVEENHSLSQMKAEMPFVYGLAKRYAYARSYTAIRHPSLPNYLAIAGGSTFGVEDDDGPSSHPIRGASVFDQARRAGRTAKLYAESAPGRCALHSTGDYVVRHNPWAYFVDGRAACQRYDVPVTALAPDAAAGRLPTVGMVVPNLVHDAHDGSLAEADAWIRSTILQVQRGPDWRSGRLAIVVTADEDDHHEGNKVLTVVASRYQSHRVVSTALSHYSLTRFIGDVAGTRYLRKAATAHSMKRAFAVRTRPRP